MPGELLEVLVEKLLTAGKVAHVAAAVKLRPHVVILWYVCPVSYALYCHAQAALAGSCGCGLGLCDQTEGPCVCQQTGVLSPTVAARCSSLSAHNICCPYYVSAGHQCVHTVSELKKGAMVSDFNSLMANVQTLAGRLDKQQKDSHDKLEKIKIDAQHLLAALEQHYYSSAHKGQLPSPQADGSSKLAELCAQALQMTEG